MIEIDAAVTTDWLESDEEIPDTDEVSAETVADVTADWLETDEDIADTDEFSTDRLVATITDCEATALE